MAIRPIRNDDDHAAALRDIKTLMMASAETPEGDRLDLIVTLVEAYEARRHPIDAPDPIEAIRFMMEQKGWTGMTSNRPLAAEVAWPRY